MVALNDAPVAREVATNGQPAEPAGSESVVLETLQPIQETRAYRNQSSIAYELSQQHLGKPRRLKIIAAGAGVSGLDLAHAVESGRLQNVELALYEKNAGLGGTWFENRYPGCACDIPSHNYLFTWAPNPKWSSFYVTAPEILAYLEDVADKFNLRKYVTTQRKIVGAQWNEQKQKWVITSKRTDGRRTVISAQGVDDGEVDEDIVEECDVFVNASGYLNNWRWPNVPGREQYKGVLAHTAVYDPSIDLKGKRVAIIGNGSSGIQVTAAVQKMASEVSVYLRNPTWVTANLGSKYIPQGQPNLFFDEAQQKQWTENPLEYLAYRKAVEKELNVRFPLFIRETPQQAMARDFTTKGMKARLAGKPELQDLLIPSYALGCRRPTPGSGYLEAMCEPNCEVVWGELETFTKDGIRSADGTERSFDVIIAATGFDVSFVPRWPIVGTDGKNLQDQWAEDPACYMSILAENMPNYMMYLGPGSPIGHGSLITSIERITLYMSDLVRKLQTENYSSFQLKQGKAKAYQHQMFSWLDKTVWGDSCQSSFKNGTRDGALHALHPGSRLHYFELLDRHRYEDFDWVSRCPEPELQFAWFANGFLSHEMDADSTTDPTWYLDQDPQVLIRFVS